MKIRRATTADVEILTKFNQRMAKETEDRELNYSLCRRGVNGVLNDPSRGFYLIAEKDGFILGSLMITYEWSDWRNGYFWWIQSVYVPPEHRGKGVFRQLFNYCLDHAKRDETTCGLRLYVHKNNLTAQQVYSSLGMEKTEYLLFEI